MLTSFGAETTIAALTTPVTPVEKNHAAWWSSLPKDVQSQLYDKIEGVGSSSQFAGFSSLPIPPKLNTYNSTEIRKFLVGIGTENIHVIDPILDIQDRIAIQQVKVAKLREQVLAEVIQNIKDEQAAMIAAQMGLAVAEGESNQNAIQIAMTSGAAPLAITQLAGMNVGTDPYTYDYGQGSSSAKSQIASSIRSALMKKAGKALAGKFAQGAALKAGLAATGVGVVPAAALAIWQNKTLRQIALAGGALAVGKTLYALTTVGGAAGGAIGAFLGAALGPVGAVAGGMIGANVGAAIPGLGGQWTGLMGWTPHAPISPFGTAGSSLSSGSGAGQSMSAMRAANTGATQPLSYSQQTALTSAPETSAVAGDAFAQASPTTTAAGSSSLTGFLGATAAAVTATAAPLIGIGIGLFLSIQVLFIIYSAFLIKVPSEGVVGKTEELSKYATLEKTASPESIDDSVSPISTDVTYAIKFEPKKEYRLQVTQVKDAFSYQGCDKKQEHSCDLSLKSPLTLNSFPPEIMTGPAEPTYSLTISAVDVMVINTLTITFDVFDTAGNKLSTNETITALAAVVIGNPTIGCFTPGTAGINLGTEKDPYITITTTDADMSKVRAAYSASILENPKFTSLVCAKGPITIYRLASNASGYYGWTTSSDSIALYTPTFSSTISTEYTLIHELGHIVDNRNAGLRATFVATLPSNLYSCFNYPFPDRCADGEAFAEAIARYVTNYRVYNLKQVHPKEHAWLKNNVFGGVEY
ncbi:MAG: hypothetical protein COU68_02355 [Candidatus Pacebacteria bacterium CG10_big_fil_rev_8_21_14_0_10_45_6]|nr:MAG: hypothetical protein COU68_02355 [Candidatus Pacebacteria bacterium CG10_big_fil_rev_8_21_14_0_10_45_6]